ncbi:MAG: SulP family inorganic anion transporter [Candidatus Nanopelagicales bacterium]
MPEWIRAKFGGMQPRTWFTMGNLLAGVAVGAYLIPQAMAYGSLAGVGAAVGLATAIIPLLAYALLGKHKWMSVGPESTVALMSAAAAAPAAAAAGMEPAMVLPIMAAIVGIVLVLGRLINAAFLADLLSLPVLVGYLTGIAVLMVMSQLQKLTGIDANTDNLWKLITETEWTVPNFKTLAVGVLVAAIAWGMPKVSTKIPGAVVALAVAIPMGIALAIPTIGPVSSSLPKFAVPDLSMSALQALIWPSITVAAVAFTDVMITSRAISDGSRSDPDREMVALGGAQFATGFFGGYPVSASSSRTALAKVSGATSKHYAVVVAGIILIAPLILGGVLAKIPQAGLAGIILYAAITLVEVPQWRKLRRLHRNEFAIAAICTLAVLFFGILPGIGIAIALSIFAFLARMARPTVSVLGFTPMSASMHGIDTHEDSDTVPGLVVFRYNAPLFFINAPDFFDEAIEAMDEDTEVLLVNMEASPNLDTTSLDTLEELAATVKEAGGELWLARTRYEVEELMEKHGVMAVVGRENLHETLGSAVGVYQASRLM